MHVTHAVRLLAVFALAVAAGWGGAPASSAPLGTMPQSVLEPAARVPGVQGIPQPAHRPGG
jgi:hypothetical protein